MTFRALWVGAAGTALLSLPAFAQTAPEPPLDPAVSPDSQPPSAPGTGADDSRGGSSVTPQRPISNDNERASAQAGGRANPKSWRSPAWADARAA